MYALDHLFVWASPAAPEADLLVKFGLAEGEPNTHPGQGTSCRRFFFRNAYLEIIWPRDDAELRSETTRPTTLWERSRGRAAGASPFGLALRPDAPGGGPPFLCWEYRPSYLPPPLAVHMSQGAPLSEPLWFFLPFGRRPDDPGRPSHQPFGHPVGFQEITRVKFSGPGLGSPSEAARAVMLTGAVELAEGPEHLAEVTFDAGVLGRVADFRPALPLVFRW